jgi:hypothetical protein
MEAAGVPESTCALLVGHKRTSITFGVYSKGERVELRDVINKLRYPPEVMRLIRGAVRSQGSQRPQSHRNHL